MKQPELNPALIEYRADGELWRCNRFDLLAAEMPVKADQLPAFHGVAITKARGWLIVRRLFGMQPVIPPASMDLDDLRIWQREELRESLSLTRAQLQAELDAVRGAWLGVLKTMAPPVPAPEKREHREEFVFTDDDLLQRFGFTMRFTNMAERAWFTQRVRDWEKVLNEKFATVLARNALMTELRIFQLDSFLNDPEKCKTGESNWTNSLKLRQTLDENYQGQISQIKELCPWAGAVAGKFAFNAVLSDISRAVQEYSARNDTRLIDGIFTATEILVECRYSVQAPEPRYRAGLIVYLNAAKAGLWDRHWQPPFEFPVLKRLDAAWKATALAAGEPTKIPDLEQDGPAGEYDDLKLPAGLRSASTDHANTHPTQTQETPSLDGATR